MNEQERQVIDDIFRRFEQVANQPRDPEAERFIAEKVLGLPREPGVETDQPFNEVAHGASTWR